MFDSVYLNVKCPYCGLKKEFECQTKDLDRTLLHLYKGDKISKEFNDLKYLNCVATCNSSACDMNRKFKYGHNIPYSRLFELNLQLKNRKITGKYTYVDIPIVAILKKL